MKLSGLLKVTIRGTKTELKSSNSSTVVIHLRPYSKFQGYNHHGICSTTSFFWFSKAGLSSKVNMMDYLFVTNMSL